MGFMFKRGDIVRLSTGEHGIVKEITYDADRYDKNASMPWYTIQCTAEPGVRRLPGKQLELVELAPQSFIVELTIETSLPVEAETVLEWVKGTVQAGTDIPDVIKMTAGAAWRMFEEPPEDSNAGQWGAQNLDDNPEPF